ncbi:hypothetical protein DICA3_F36378 [Diutina catenulata]
MDLTVACESVVGLVATDDDHELATLKDEVQKYPLHTQQSIVSLATAPGAVRRPIRRISNDDRSRHLMLLFGSAYVAALPLVLSPLTTVSPIVNRLYSIVEPGTKTGDTFLSEHYEIEVVGEFARRIEGVRSMVSYQVDLASWYCQCSDWHRQISDGTVDVPSPFGEIRTFASIPTCKHLVATLILVNEISIDKE